MPDLYPKVEDVADKVKHGVTQVEIAALYGVNIPCIHTRVRRARQLGLLPEPEDRTAQKQVSKQRIIEASKDGASVKIVAERVGLSENWTCRLVNELIMEGMLPPKKWKGERIENGYVGRALAGVDESFTTLLEAQTPPGGNLADTLVRLAMERVMGEQE